MKVNVYESFFENGRERINPLPFENVDLTVDNNVAMIYSDRGVGEMTAYPITIKQISVSARGMRISGLQERKAGVWTWQEWWCVPI